MSGKTMNNCRAESFLRTLFMLVLCPTVWAENWARPLAGEYSNAMLGRDFLYLRVYETGLAVYSNSDGVITGKLARNVSPAGTIYSMDGKFENLLDSYTFGFEFESTEKGFHLAGMEETLSDLLNAVTRRKQVASQPAGRDQDYYEYWMSPCSGREQTSAKEVGGLLHGMYSNFAESFSGVGLTVCSNNFAVLHFSFGSMGGDWTYSEHKGHHLLLLNMFDSEAAKDTVCLFEVNLLRTTLKWAAMTNTLENALAQFDTGLFASSKSSGEGVFYLVTNAVPQRLMEVSVDFPKRKAEIKAKKERTLYERATRQERETLVDKIMHDPKSILTLPLPEGSFSARSPALSVEIAALREAFAVGGGVWDDGLVLAFANRPEVRSQHFYLLYYWVVSGKSVSEATKAKLLAEIFEGYGALKGIDMRELIEKSRYPDNLLKTLIDNPRIPVDVQNMVRQHLGVTDHVK